VLAVRDTIHERMIVTQAVAHAQKRPPPRFYFSLEYLMGRLFGNNLLATGLFETARAALSSLGRISRRSARARSTWGLGNGGLGRLAACFMDSLATLRLSRRSATDLYEFGLFKQAFVNGSQIAG